MAVLRVTGEAKKALAKIKALQRQQQNMQPVFARIGRSLLSRIQLCFKLGIDPWKSPWARLKWRKGQPLRDTGRMQRSIVSRPDPKGVTVGTNVVQARVHQFGATIRPKNGPFLIFPGPGGKGLVFSKKVTIPARPYLPLRRNGSNIELPPEWSADIVRALRAHFAIAEKAT